MKVTVKVLWSFLLGVILLTAILAYTPTLAQLSNYNPQGLKATTLEEVLALPDEEVDLATAILILCKRWDASVDVVACLEEIEMMALELEIGIILEDNPKKIVSLINHYLFEKKNYSSVLPSDPDYIKLENSALPWVIENKKGDCLGLSLLYLALTERLRLPFYGIAVPTHVFVRYDDGKKKINIETTGKGYEYKDRYYEKEFMLHPTYKNYNFYLRNLSKREVIGLFLSDLGVVYGLKGMYNEAIAELKKAIMINPNNAEAHSNLGVVYIIIGMHDEAIAEYKKGIEINPNDAKAHYNLGAAYHEKGMHNKAITELKKAIEINPNLAEAHDGLGLAYLNKGMYDEAIAEWKKAIEINPNLAEAHYSLGSVYVMIGMYDEAIAEYKKAIEINPNLAEAHNNLGGAYINKGMYDEAIAEYKKGIEINPDLAEAHYGLSLAYLNKGMYDEAIAECKKAIEINPNLAEAHNNLAIVYYFKGEYSLAIKHCDRAIELGFPVDPQFLEALKPYR